MLPHQIPIKLSNSLSPPAINKQGGRLMQRPWGTAEQHYQLVWVADFMQLIGA